jgi:hypothetical protein
MKTSYREAAMDLVVVHNIHDSEGWKKALAEEHETPPEFALRAFVEAVDGTRAVCMWEAPTQAGLQEHVDRLFGHAVVNDVFPVQVSYFEGRVD